MISYNADVPTRSVQLPAPSVLCPCRDQKAHLGSAMCNFVVPIRTCSKCHQREPLFHDTPPRDNEKAGSHESLTYMDAAQDCYSRWCVFSSEHPKTCSHCWLTCKHGHGKTREIQGGSPSYVCHSCAPRVRCQPAWRRPRPAHPNDAAQGVCVPSRGSWGLAR